MNSLNKVQLIGNTTGIPEVRATPNGSKVANFSLATTRKWKDAAGVKQEQTEFHNIVAWSGLATLAEQYIGKGKQLYIEGRLQTDSWEHEGVKRYKTTVVVENMILLKDSKNSSDSSEQEPLTDDFPDESKQTRKSTPKKEDEIDIADIPF